MLRLLSLGGTDELVDKLLEDQKKIFNPLTAVVMGVAWGGDVEVFARRLSGVGEVYGFDTFNGIPRFLCKNQMSLDAQCMIPFYEQNGTDGLKLETQQAELDRQGLRNAHLIPGLIHPHSCRYLSNIHFALLDLDIETSMRYAYWAVWPNMVPGSILVTHDVVPEGHMPWNYKLFFGELIWGNEWEVILRDDPHGLIAWRRKQA